ncbi:MAG: transcriptional repressor [Desulfomonilia bacterium]|jgi:Fur family ferric uptake transcriptional regulator
MTRQRRIILEELQKSREHPSAAELYEKVRQRLPHISLGTVYRNLEMLASEGSIRKLDMGLGQRRFDGVTDDHQHIRCTVCDRMDDIPAPAGVDPGTLLEETSRTSGYVVNGFTLDIYGVCPGCAARASVNGSGSD